jgi:hypothetical protein
MLKLSYRTASAMLLGISTFVGTMLLSNPLDAEPAPSREREVAYCNTAEFAIKIYTQEGLDPEAPGADDTFIRIYDRSDNLSFINSTPVSHQSTSMNNMTGTVYENLRGENQWQLFVATNPGEGFDPESPNANPSAGVHQCVLSRDGETIAYGQGRVSETTGGSGNYPGTPGGSGYYPGNEPSRPSYPGN